MFWVVSIKRGQRRSSDSLSFVEFAFSRTLSKSVHYYLPCPSVHFGQDYRDTNNTTPRASTAAHTIASPLLIPDWLKPNKNSNSLPTQQPKSRSFLLLFYHKALQLLIPSASMPPPAAPNARLYTRKNNKKTSAPATRKEKKAYQNRATFSSLFVPFLPRSCTRIRAPQNKGGERWCGDC